MKKQYKLFIILFSVFAVLRITVLCFDFAVDYFYFDKNLIKELEECDFNLNESYLIENGYEKGEYSDGTIYYVKHYPEDNKMEWSISIEQKPEKTEAKKNYIDVSHLYGDISDMYISRFMDINTPSYDINIIVFYEKQFPSSASEELVNEIRILMG